MLSPKEMELAKEIVCDILQTGFGLQHDVFVEEKYYGGQAQDIMDRLDSTLAVLSEICKDQDIEFASALIHELTYMFSKDHEEDYELEFEDDDDDF